MPYLSTGKHMKFWLFFLSKNVRERAFDFNIQFPNWPKFRDLFSLDEDQMQYHPEAVRLCRSVVTNLASVPKFYNKKKCGKNSRYLNQNYEIHSIDAYPSTFVQIECTMRWTSIFITTETFLGICFFAKIQFINIHRYVIINGLHICVWNSNRTTNCRIIWPNSYNNKNGQWINSSIHQCESDVPSSGKSNGGTIVVSVPIYRLHSSSSQTFVSNKYKKVMIFALPISFLFN